MIGLGSDKNRELSLSYDVSSCMNELQAIKRCCLLHTSLNWPSTTAWALKAGAGFWTIGAKEGREEEIKQEGEVEKEEVSGRVEVLKIFGANRRSAMAAIFWALQNWENSQKQSLSKSCGIKYFF